SLSNASQGVFRQGLVEAASAARRASSFAFGPGEILSVTQISVGVIFATARYDVILSGDSGSSLALSRMIKATGTSFPFCVVRRHSAFGPTLEKPPLTTLHKSSECCEPFGVMIVMF